MIEYIKLMRLNQPTGFFLVFWPCSFGLLLASQYKIPIFFLVLFFIGSIIMRGAGCVVNDIIDRDIDKHVLRTKNRPIANGRISAFKAAAFCVFLSFIGFLILISLPTKAIYIGIFSVILIITYPFMKRITNYPQAFLAVTFNIGAVIGYFSIKSDMNYSLFLLYIACILWTLGYDTIYGHQDKKYDKKIGIKSTSITFENNTKRVLLFFYSGMFLCLLSIGFLENAEIFFYIFVALSYMQLLWQVISLDTDSPEDCLQKFKSNIYLGALVFCAFLFI